MCMGYGFGTPNGGVPIPMRIHDQFSPEVKEAWVTFDGWWQSQDPPASRASMPLLVAQAFEIMKNAPIPEYDGYFGKDSCYVRGVENQLVD